MVKGFSGKIPCGLPSHSQYLHRGPTDSLQLRDLWTFHWSLPVRGVIYRQPSDQGQSLGGVPRVKIVGVGTDGLGR